MIGRFFSKTPLGHRIQRRRRKSYITFLCVVCVYTWRGRREILFVFSLFFLPPFVVTSIFTRSRSSLPYLSGQTDRHASSISRGLRKYLFFLFSSSSLKHSFNQQLYIFLIVLTIFIYLYFNRFRIDNTDHIIDVNKNNIPFEYDQVNIICPVYTPGTHEDDAEKYIIYNVSKEEYDTCRITNPNPRIIAVCDKPYKLMYFTITFRSFTPQPGGLEFRPGQDYYFICKFFFNPFF